MLSLKTKITIGDIMVKLTNTLDMDKFKNILDIVTRVLRVVVLACVVVTFIMLWSDDDVEIEVYNTGHVSVDGVPSGLHISGGIRTY